MVKAEIIIELDSYDKFRNFVNGIEKYDTDITASTLDGKKRVDAKSLMGLLTLDSIRDFVLEASFETEKVRDEFLEAMKPFGKEQNS